MRQKHTVSTYAVVLVAACSGLLSGLCGCSSKDSNETRSDEAKRAPVEPETEPLTPLPLAPMGASSLRDYAYSRGKGRASFSKALAVHRDSEPKDWAAIAEHCEAALAADPAHLEAHWYLGLARARAGQHAQVVEHLSAAIAGDFMRWGERSLSIKALSSFYETQSGRQFRDLVARYRLRFRELVAGGVLVVGRRGKPWYPKRAGKGSLNHRSEIYAYHRDSARYIRVSRTNGSLIGFLRAPTGTELAYVSYRAVWLPTDQPAPSAEPNAESSTPPLQPYIRKLTIGTIDLERVVMSKRDIELSGVAELWLSYASRPARRPKLLARVLSPRSEDTPNEPAIVRTYRLDVARGRAELLTVDGAPDGAPDGAIEQTDPARAQESGHTDEPKGASAPVLRGDILRVAYDRADYLRLPIDGVLADWDDRGAAGSFRLEHTRTTVTLADGGLALGHTMSWSPARTRLAFAQQPESSVADCEPGAATEATPLYTVEATTGALRQVAATVGLQAPFWVDERHLAYTDPGGTQHTPARTPAKAAARTPARIDSAVHIIDVESGEVTNTLTALGGLGTRYLPGAPFTRPGCDEP